LVDVVDTIDIVKNHLMSEEKENKQDCEGRLQLPLLPPMPLNWHSVANGTRSSSYSTPPFCNFRSTSNLGKPSPFVIDPVGRHAVGPSEASIVHNIACKGEQA
jgi:hypothetical protein